MSRIDEIRDEIAALKAAAEVARGERQAERGRIERERYDDRYATEEAMANLRQPFVGRERLRDDRLSVLARDDGRAASEVSAQIAALDAELNRLLAAEAAAAERLNADQRIAEAAAAAAAAEREKIEREIAEAARAAAAAERARASERAE